MWKLEQLSNVILWSVNKQIQVKRALYICSYGHNTQNTNSRVYDVLEISVQILVIRWECTRSLLETETFILRCKKKKSSDVVNEWRNHNISNFKSKHGHTEHTHYRPHIFTFRNRKLSYERHDIKKCKCLIYHSITTYFNLRNNEANVSVCFSDG